MPFITLRRLPEFKYYSPKTLEEAISLLVTLKDAVVMAGGTDLLVMMKERELMPQHVINVKEIFELRDIRETEDNGVMIGATTRIVEIRRSETIKKKYYALWEATIKAFHSWQIANMATIGGNVCRSLPTGDTIIPLIVFDARLRLLGSRGERIVPLENFIVGPGKNTLERDEILTKIILPPLKSYTGSAFEAIRRTSNDLAKISCAVRITMDSNRCEDIRIALGGVAPAPFRAREAEEVIRGQLISDEIIEKVSQKVKETVTPRTSHRATAEYRRYVSGVLTKRLIKMAAERAMQSS